MARPKSAKRENPRTLAFVQEYVWGEDAGNGGACAAKVGMGKTPGSSRELAHRLLREPSVAALVDAEAAERKRQIKQAFVSVLEETRLQASARLITAYDERGKFKSLDEMPEDIRASIVSIKTRVDEDGATILEVKQADKVASQKLYAQLCGELTEKVEHDVGPTLEELIRAAASEKPE